MHTLDLILDNHNLSAFAEILGPFVGGTLGDAITSIATFSYVREVVYALSITQKETIANMLHIGARCFEFRPAQLPDASRLAGGSSLPAGKQYFIHRVTPGLDLDSFLDSVLGFLEAYDNEIVVVQMRRDGVDGRFPTPSDNLIDQVVNESITRRGGKVLAATEDDFKKLSVNDLRSANKCLVVTKEYDGNQYSSWNGDAYATLNPGPLIERFEGMSGGQQGKTTFTELQCQATATTVPGALAYSVGASNAATSLLRVTKALCDRGTLTWIKSNALSKFSAEKSLVIMNDWMDGATCNVAIELSKQRFAA